MHGARGLCWQSCMLMNNSPSLPSINHTIRDQDPDTELREWTDPEIVYKTQDQWLNDSLHRYHHWSVHHINVIEWWWWWLKIDLKRVILKEFSTCILFCFEYHRENIVCLFVVQVQISFRYSCCPDRWLMARCLFAFELFVGNWSPEPSLPDRFALFR